MGGNSCINKTVWLKRSFTSEEKEEGGTWARRLHYLPLSPTIISPSGSSSCFPGPIISSCFTNFCTCSTLWEEKWQKLHNYTTGSHCDQLRDGTQHPSDPSWSHDKLHAILKCFLEGRCHFGKLAILDKLSDIFEGQMTCRSKKDRPDSSVLQQCPKVTKRVSIIHFSVSLRNHIFLPWLTFSDLGPTSLL